MLQVIWRIPINIWNDDGIPIYGFGLMLFLAFLLCTWLAGRLGKPEGITKEQIQDLAIWLFIGGLLGARITYLIDKPPQGDWVNFLKEIPRIWDGGIILYGAILGGAASYALAYFLVFRKQGLSTLRLADVVAPSMAVGLCLGRLGCFLNGCCFGQVACADCAVVPVHFPLPAPAREYLVDQGAQTTAGFLVDTTFFGEGARVAFVEPTSAAALAGLEVGDLIIAVNGKSITENDGKPIDSKVALGNIFYQWQRGRATLDLTVRPKDSEEEVTRSFVPRTLGLYPTQLYEVVSMTLLLLLLLAYFPLRHYPGQVMAVMMMGYAVHRYLNEILRDDPRPIGFERYSSVFLFLAGAVLWGWLWDRARRGEVPAPPGITLPQPPAAPEGPAATMPS